MQTFSGLMFGAFEYSWMLEGAFLRVDVLLFLTLASCPFIFLCGLKAKLTDANVRLYALARPFRHVIADFLFAGGATGSFSILVSAYSKGQAVIDKDYSVPPHTAILLGNLALFALAVYLFSILAKKERIAIEGGKP